jgi:hypothetical protein
VVQVPGRTRSIGENLLIDIGATIKLSFVSGFHRKRALTLWQMKGTIRLNHAQRRLT